MKHWMKQLMAAGLALSLMAGQAALASDALGHDLHAGTAGLSQGVSLTHAHFWSDTYKDLRTEHYLTYTPGQAVQPVLAYGDTVIGKATLTEMARQLEARGKRVLGGTNGDFYVVATGQPLGLVVTEGVLRSSSSYLHALGFRADGTAFIGQPSLRLAATLPSGRVEITGGLNKIRQVNDGAGGGLTLMTPDFADNTQNSSAGVDVILRPVTENVGEPVPQEELWHELEPTPVPTPTPTPGDGETADPEITPDAQVTPVPEETHPEEEAVPPPAAPVSLEAEEELTEPQPRGEEPVPLVYGNQPRIGSRLVCRVEQVLETEKGDPATPLAPGTLVLTMNGADNAYILDKLRALQTGEEIQIDIWSEDARWNEAVEATGALYHLLENGQVVPGLEKTAAPRTAVGIKADGTVIFYTIDGRLPGYSVGAGLHQVALRLQELGCVDAVGLDGGGSTTLGAVYPDGEALGLVNRPSGGKERANATALFLTTDLEPSGDPASLMLTPGDSLVLSGSTLPVTATTVDSHWYAMGPTQNVTYSVSGPGSVDEAGIFTAGASAGTAIVTGAQPGGVRGEAVFTVVDTPDKIALRNQTTGAPVVTLALSPNQQVDLTASAQWHKLALVSQDTSYTWACDPEVGTVTPEGVFTAAGQTAEGSLTVTAGANTLELKVSVAGHALPLNDMEGDLSPFISTDTARASAEDRLTHVRTGRRSLRVDYDASLSGTAQLNTALTIPQGERFLGLWVLGDGSGSSLAAVFADAQGNELPAPVGGLTSTGWTHAQVTIPEGAVSLLGLRLIYGGGDKTAGTIWLDQLTTSTEPEADHTPPTVTLEQKGSRITAWVGDDLDRGFAAGAVTMTVDGRTVPAVWNEAHSTLTYDLPPLPVPEVGEGETPVQPTGLRRVTVTAVDVSGNLGRASLDTGLAGPNAFADMELHWALPFVSYLYEQKVTNGIVEGEKRYFLPDNNITRAEFFTMTARWLGLDLNAYGEVALPFADLSLVPEWALPAIQAMYALGYVGGSQGVDGLYVNPNLAINRAEAMTILGRIQPRGWPEAELSAFTDGDQVPQWAESYVRSLVGQKVVGGYDDGSLRPNATMTRGQVAKVLTVLR